MPEYLSPGVYVEEIPSGPRPIEGVSTSTAGFVGLTERGPLRPRLVTSWGDYQSWFGGLIDESISYLPFAVRDFFENGGQRLFVARVTRNGAAAASLTHPTADAAQNLVVTATGPGVWGDRIFLRIGPATVSTAVLPRIRITLLYYTVMPPTPFVDPLDRANVANPNRREPDAIEDYDNMGIQPTDSDQFMARVNSLSHLVELNWGAPAAAASRPADTGFIQLTTVPGDDGAAAGVAADYLGNEALPPDQRTGLAGLAASDRSAAKEAPLKLREDGSGQDSAYAAAIDREDAERSVLGPRQRLTAFLDRADRSARRNVVTSGVRAWRPPICHRPVASQPS